MKQAQLADSLDVLLADGVIDEVLGRIKSGKEATISMVRRGDRVLAAKVYKDRAIRSFKNNVEYKEGRKVRNTRTQRAMDSGGKFGRESAEQAWKSAEADALYRLVETGVRAPVPVMFYEGVLLMELVLDHDGRPAPRLEEITLERDAVMGVYCDLVAQLIALLCCDLVHGDLSPYNILLAVDGPTIIDFPQVISSVHNSRAEHFFMRDFANVHSHLAAIDPALWIHRQDGRAIWQAYVRRDLTPQFVPPPPPAQLSPRRNERAYSPRSSEQHLHAQRPSPPPPTPSRDDDYRASPPRPKIQMAAQAPIAPKPTGPKPLYSHWTGQDTKPAQPAPRGSTWPNDGRSRRDNSRESRRPNDQRSNQPRDGARARPTNQRPATDPRPAVASSSAASPRPASTSGAEPTFGQGRRRRRRR
jgi:RIO kinase 1